MVQDHVDVKLLGITLTVTATPTAIPADGVSTSKVRARLVETTSKVPLDGEDVRFGSTAGAITGRVATDATGTATATLTATATGNAGITVYYGNILTSTTSVSFSALTLTLSAAPASVVGDGNSTTFITARLVSALLNPIAGVQVRFTTNLGSITGSAITDASGEARATLRAASGVGTATVSATYEGAPTATLNCSLHRDPDRGGGSALRPAQLAPRRRRQRGHPGRARSGRRRQLGARRHRGHLLGRLRRRQRGGTQPAHQGRCGRSDLRRRAPPRGS